MKKTLLLIAFAAVAMTSSAAEKNVVWTGSADINWDGSTAPTVAADKLTGLTAGDKIIVTVSAINPAQQWPGCTFRSVDGNKDLGGIGLWDYKTATFPLDVEFEIPYNNETVAAFKTGFYVVGSDWTLTQLAVEHSGDPSVVIPDNVLWFTPNPEYLNWNQVGSVSADKAAVLEAGMYINITVSKVNEHNDTDGANAWPQITVKTSDWNTELAYFPMFDAVNQNSPFVLSFQVTAENIDNVHKGFFLTGADAWVSAIAYSNVPGATTGIDVVNADYINTTVYNLQGIRVCDYAHFDNLPAGIYIVNGKKIKK